MHDFLKTRNGERQIDLHPSVAKMLREFIGERKSYQKSDTQSDMSRNVTQYKKGAPFGVGVYTRPRSCPARILADHRFELHRFGELYSLWGAFSRRNRIF